MSSRVILKVTRGEKRGETFEYTEKARVLIGRQEDCAIVVPERTVSRYHCLLEILPPEIRLQDFGSLNGTFLNGRKIGQRDRDTSWEEAKDQSHEAFDLKDGDVLGLGSQCEITCTVETRESCARCGADLPEIQADPNATLLISGEIPGRYLDEDGNRICEKCSRELREERERAEREQAQAQAQAQQAQAHAQQAQQAQAQAQQAQQAQAADAPVPAGKRKCSGCGKLFTPKAADNNLCPDCLADRAKLLEGVLGMLNINARGGKQNEEPPKPAPQKPEPQKVNASGQKPEAPAAPRKPAAPLKPSILTGYDQVSLLGKGGMGEVWKVRERATGKDFALKTMLPDAAMNEQARKLFLREAGICECLQHPNVVRAYKSGCIGKTLYILMDLCEGGSVDGLIKREGGKLKPEMATWIMLQVLSGLDYVHNMDLDVEIKAGRFRGMKEVSVKGVVHRDFKPGNIFLSDDSDHPRAMVADFGMAKAFAAAGKSQISRTGAVAGTPVFMPRQQAQDCKYAKPEVDVWAAAASYYFMLTGTFPKNFRPGVNVFQVLIMEAAVPIRDRNPSVPEGIARVIDRALVERPKLTYSSAADLRRDLVSVLPQNVKNYCRKIL